MMLRSLKGVSVMLVLLGWCRAAEVRPAEPPAYRYLILVEASAAMARQKEVAMDTVHKLVLSGFYGRIQRGDVLGVWTFKDEVNQKLVRPIHWSPREARDLSNFLYRKLRDLEFSKKSDLSPALTAMTAEAGRSELLTVFLVTSGAELIKGTAFDAEINSVFQQHGEALAKAGRPFVTVLVFESGEVAAQAVTPGGRTIYIPPATASAVTEAPRPVAAKPEAVPPPPPPKPISVEEIEAKLRESQAEQRRAASRITTETGRDSVSKDSDPEDSAPAVTGAVGVGVGGQEAVEPAAPSEPGLADARAERTTQEDEGPRTAPVITLPATGEDGHRPSAVASEVQPVGALGPVEEPQVEQVPRSLPAAPGHQAEATDSTREETAAPGMVLPPGTGREDRRVYLGIGVGLFLTAAVIVLWRIRSPRRRVRASVISQSMQRK